MTTINITSLKGEVLYQPTPNIQLTSLKGEVLYQPTPNIQLTSLKGEVLRSNLINPTTANITSIFEEQWTAKTEFIPFEAKAKSILEEQWTAKTEFIPFEAKSKGIFVEEWVTFYDRISAILFATESRDSSEIIGVVKRSADLFATDSRDTITIIGNNGDEFWHLYVSNPPDAGWGYYDGIGGLQGLLIQRNLTLLLSASSEPIYSNWLSAGINIQVTYIRYDQKPGYTITTIYNGGFISSGNTPYGTDCVIFLFRPSPSTTSITMQRGEDSITVDFPSNAVMATSKITNYGFNAIGDGFFMLWATMTGTSVKVYPGGTTGIGSVDWLQLQILKGCQYPAPIGSTSASIDAIESNFGDSFYVTSVITQLINQPYIDLGIIADEVFFGSDLGYIHDTPNNLIDLGTVETSPIAPYMFFGSSNIFPLLCDLGYVTDKPTSAVDFNYDMYQIYYFPKGIATVGGLLKIITDSNIAYLTGNNVTLNDSILGYSKYGVIILRMYSLFKGWRQSDVQPLLSLLDILGTGLVITLEDESIVINLYNSIHRMTIEDWHINIGLVWGPNSVIVFVNGNSFTYTLNNVNLQSAFSFVNCRIFDGTVPKSTWLLRLVLLLGANSPYVLPDSSVISTIISEY